MRYPPGNENRHKYGEDEMKGYLRNRFLGALCYDIGEDNVTVWFDRGGSITMPRDAVEGAMDRRRRDRLRF